jgi:predicted transcriptional regulator
MKSILTDAILSIKPIYAKNILSGGKKVEFRKKIFKKSVERVYIYSSSPQKMIVGYFTIKEIVEDTPSNLWKKFHNVGGIDKDSFFEYFKDSDIGYSLVIKKVVKFDEEKDPIDFMENFSAPQSYIYLEREIRKNDK